MMSIKKAKIPWACRRGLLECDLFLHSFIAKRLNFLTADEIDQLDELLQVSDPMLYEWLMGGEPPESYRHLLPMITQIRCTVLK